MYDSCDKMHKDLLFQQIIAAGLSHPDKGKHCWLQRNIWLWTVCL